MPGTPPVVIDIGKMDEVEENHDAAVCAQNL
jgi:hypothetical protein